MKKALFIAVCAIGVLCVIAVLVWRFGWWSTVCVGESPDGTIRATVRCHYIYRGGFDGRHHYYLSFDPEREFRPISVEVTVKTSTSAFKNDRVVQDWKTKHNVGYLQGFDDVDERRPLSIQWEKDGTVSLRSRKGIAGRYELRR